MDSLQKIITTTPVDSIRAISLCRLSWYMKTIDPDSAIRLATQARELSDKIGYLHGSSMACNNLAIFWYRKGNYSRAINFNKRAIEQYEAARDTSGIVACLNLMGNISLAQENRQEALAYYEKTLTYARRSSPPSSLALIYSNLGSVYHELKQPDKTLENYYAAIKILEEQKDSKGLALLYLNMGAVYSDENILELSESFFRKSLAISESYLLNDYTAQCHMGLCGIYARQKKFREAEASIALAQEIVTKMGDKELIKNCAETAAEMYKQMGDYQKAYENLNQAFVYRDSLLNESNLKQVAELRQQFETESKERAIEVLTKDKQLKETQISSQRNLIYVAIGGLAIVLVFSFFLYRNYTAKKKGNILLSEQNKIISLKQQEIADSLAYAKRIQQAIYSDSHVVKDLFPSGFGFAEPKNVVGGDFYWFTSAGGKSLIAAADCTGHGVPGAFVSIIANNMLNDAVQKEGLVDPSQILAYLNLNVRRALKQDHGSTRDGLDIVLVAADLEAKTLVYAGANRPLYFFSGGELTEYKPTKASIGGFTEAGEEFASQKIDYKEGDTFYIFSDGYADQFGGPKGKKLTTRRLKEILTSMQPKNMREQEVLIQEHFNKWKGDNEQTDDVLIIGIRL